MEKVFILVVKTDNGGYRANIGSGAIFREAEGRTPSEAIGEVILKFRQLFPLGNLEINLLNM
jgi:hypothetical protein